MKRSITIRLITFMLILAPVFATTSFASAPPPPPPPHGETGDQPGNAPIGSGIAIMLTLAAGYGYKRFSADTQEN